MNPSAPKSFGNEQGFFGTCLGSSRRGVFLYPPLFLWFPFVLPFLLGPLSFVDTHIEKWKEGELVLPGSSTV